MVGEAKFVYVNESQKVSSQHKKGKPCFLGKSDVSIHTCHPGNSGKPWEVAGKLEFVGRNTLSPDSIQATELCQKLQPSLSA